MADKLSWADHRQMEDAQPGAVKLPDGSLIMRGQPKPTEQPPGFFAGLRQWASQKLNPAPAQPAPFWIPEAAPAAPVVTPAPVAVAPGGSLPAYNAWQDIEDEAAKEQRIKEKLGTVSSNILNNKAIIEGKWFGGR